MTSLGCLRQKPSSFENFGCQYSTALASISSNRNRGSFDSKEVVSINVEEEMLFRVESHVFASEEFESKVIQISYLFLRIFDFAAITLM